jgi:hypothetical protein
MDTLKLIIIHMLRIPLDLFNEVTEKVWSGDQFSWTPTKFGRRFEWTWKDWVGLILLTLIIWGICQGQDALAFLKQISKGFGFHGK